MYAQESNKNIVVRTYSLRVTYYATVHHPPRFTQATKKTKTTTYLHIEIEDENLIPLRRFTPQ